MYANTTPHRTALPPSSPLFARKYNKNEKQQNTRTTMTTKDSDDDNEERHIKH